MQIDRKVVNPVQMVLQIVGRRVGEAVEVGMGHLKLAADLFDLLGAPDDDVADGEAQFEDGGLFVVVPGSRAVPDALLPESERRSRPEPYGPVGSR